MKIVYISDLHLRPTPPINRKDDYVEAQFRKLDFLIQKTNEIDGELFIGGDVFDRSINHPSWFLNRVMRSFSALDEEATVIPGNHDLVGHNLSLLQTDSIALLYYTNCYVAMNVNSFPLDGEGNTFFTSIPFGEVPPVPNTEWQKNILMLHEPVFEDAVPFYMPDALTVEQLEDKYPGYDLYLAGDIHIPCQKSKTLVSGSMMRMTTVQKDHRPRFYIIDSDTLEVETVFFPIEEDVWKLESDVQQSEEFSQELKELSTAMEERGIGLDYPTALQTLSSKEHWQTFDSLIQEYERRNK